jgi:hypothetical protein
MQSAFSAWTMTKAPSRRQHLLAGVRDDQMKRVVDHRLAPGALVVVLDRRAQAGALHLAGEGQHGGGAAAGRGNGAAKKVVGHPGAVAHGLVQMAMTVHATRQHQAAGGVNHVGCGAQVLAQGGDPPALYAQIAGETVGGGGHRSVTDHQIEVGQSVVSFRSSLTPDR